MTEIKVSKNLKGDNVFKTLNDALNNAGECDKIYIYAGLYREQIYITKKVHIYAEKGTLLILDNNTSGSAVMAISAECIIENIIVKSTNGTSLQINYCNNVKLQNCQFYSLNGDCMSIYNSDYLEFVRCTFQSIGDSIYYTACFGNKCILTQCIIKSDRGYGITLAGEALVDIQKTTIETLQNYNIKLIRNASIAISESKLLYPKDKGIILDYGTPRLNPNFKLDNT